MLGSPGKSNGKCKVGEKLDMDFARAGRLRGRMAETPTTSPRDDLLRRLFYLLTARFEDGAGIAMDGQAEGLHAAAQVTLANRLHVIAEEVIILADVVVALADISVKAADQGIGQG